MKRYMVLYIFCLISVVFLSSLESHGYRERAHRAINGAVVNQKIGSGSLKGYFAVQLGYSSVRTTVNKTRIIEWFEDAGAQEDEPALRTPNHFLDPISNKAIVGAYEPTAVWAQKGAGKQSPGGSYSWQDARAYFFTALTSATGSLREENLGQSFRALGQVMHLVADMSVPEHTRDNSHIFIYTIEKWAEEAFNFNKDTQKPFFKNYAPRLTNALNNPVPPDPSLLKQVGKFVSSNGVSAPIPIANLYDFELYTGLNPSITTTGPIGLAEYTNANFFSRNTIFKNYNYPAESSVQLYEEIDEESGKPMKFIRKIKDGELVDHLAQPNVFHKYLPIVTDAYTIVNDKIYADYLEKLIPRAVGYAGALVDYFYRGKIDLSFTPTDISFRSIKVTAQNATPGEEMGLGDIALIIRYKAFPETLLYGSKYLLNNPPEGTATSDYTYKVIKPSNQVDLKDPNVLTFDLSNDAMPLYFTDMTMQLVYKGPLGNELKDAVAVSQPKAIDGIYSDFAVSLPPSGVYAKTSSDSVDSLFNELRVTATSDIPGGLSGGSIWLHIEHTIAKDDPFQSVAVGTFPDDAAGYLIKVPVSNGVTTLAQGVPTELAFNLSSNPLPVKAADVHINVVYMNSDGTKPIAVGVRDISEPTPVDVFNNTDYSCLNGQWYKYDDPAAMAIVDSNGDNIADKSDIYPHAIGNISFLAGAANSQGSLDARTASTLFIAGSVQPGQSLRLGYILTDYSNSYAFSETRTGLNNDPWPHVISNRTYPGTGFRNDYNMWRAMYTFRSYKMWWGEGVVFTNQDYNGTCTLDALNQQLGL